MFDFFNGINTFHAAVDANGFASEQNPPAAHALDKGGRRCAESAFDRKNRINLRFFVPFEFSMFTPSGPILLI
jgi:hypothetical protein